MGAAWRSLLAALLMLVALELVFERMHFLRENFRNSHFLGDREDPAEPAEEVGELVASEFEKPPLTPVPIHTSRVDVRQLFHEMATGKRKRLRIAYFADSITEGDLVTEQLRRDLQGFYGGLGVGFQGIAPRDATFRVSLNHQPSKEWLRADLHEWRNNHSIPLGINGEAYHLAPSKAAGSLKLEKNSQSQDPWYERATLYWGKGPIALNAGESHFDLDGAGEFNAFPIPLTPLAKLKISISAAPGVWIYGVSLDSIEGVTLDNFTFRGNGGDGLANLDPKMLQAGQNALAYDLVLLHFGINALHHGDTDYHWYRAGLRKTFEHFKKNIPGAKIAVLSLIDHAEKVNGKIVSDASLPYVLAAQEAAAKDSGLWFVNLYSMMGGPGVMRAWVEGPEALANKDYTHPNRKGGARLAKYIRAALLGESPPNFGAAEGLHAP